jgi:hypothetical protein
VTENKKSSRARLAPYGVHQGLYAANPKVSTAVRGMDVAVRASLWKRPTVLFYELQYIVENLQEIVENSEEIITVPHAGSLMYARSWKSQVDRRESVTLSIP